MYWFSGVCGGLWYLLNEDGGIIWFRILGVILNTSTFILSYKLLQNYVSKLPLLLSLVMVLFVNDYGFLTFYHNQITAFFSVCIVFALHRGLVQANYKWLLLAGIIYVLNGLTRLPNFVFGLIFLVLPFYFYVNKIKFKLMLKPMAFVLFGIGFGVIIAFTIQVYNGHLPIMKQALYTMMDVGKTEGSSHNFRVLLLAQYFNLVSIISSLFQFLLAFVIVTLLLFFTKRKSLIFNFILVLYGVFIVYWVNYNAIFSIYSLAYVACLLIVFSKKIESNQRVIGFMGIIMLGTMTLGTAGGINSSGYMAIWIAFPLFYLSLPIVVLKIKEFGKKRIKYPLQYNTKITTTLIVVISISFLALKAFKISQEAYFDIGNRMDKTYLINNKKARHIYTTERRANIVNNMLKNLNTYVSEGDYLFAYDHIPMVHFLTNTKPYTYNPWPGIYDSFSFEKENNEGRTRNKYSSYCIDSEV